MKKLFKAIAILTSFSVLTRALGFLFRIFLSRLIGAEGLGIYQISFSVFMVLETFVSSGLPLVVSKKTSNMSTQKDKKKEYSMVTAALIVGLITAITLCSIVLIFRDLFGLLFTDKRCLNILIVLLPGLVFSSVYAILRGNLWGHRKYFLVSLTEFLEQLFRMIFCIIALGVFYSAVDGAMVASVSYLISCFLSASLVTVIYFKTKGRFSKPQKGQFKSLIKDSTPITLVRVISSLLMPIISIIIPLQLIKCGYTNEQALAVFGVAMGMTFPLLYIPSTLIGSLSMTLIPDLSCAVSQQNIEEIKNKVNFSIKFGLFVAFLFIPIFYSLGRPIGEFLYNSTQSGVFLSYACPLIIPICLSGLTVSCLNALNLEVKGFINYAIGACFLFVCVFFLTKYLGILSLVWGMGLCLGTASALNIRLLNKHLNTNFFNFSYLLKLLVCAIPSILISKWSYNLLTNVLPMIFSIGTSAMLGELFFISFAVVFNLLNLSIIKSSKEKSKKPFLMHKTNIKSKKLTTK